MKTSTHKPAVGSRVRLRSGGPAMTVVGSFDHLDIDLDGVTSIRLVTCAWFEGARAASSSFPIDALRILD